MKPYNMPELLTLAMDIKTIEDCSHLFDYINENSHHYNQEMVKSLKVSLAIYSATINAIERIDKLNNDEPE